MVCSTGRRGVRPEALRAFCKKIGVSTNQAMTDIALLEECVRDDLDAIVARRKRVKENHQNQGLRNLFLFKLLTNC